MARRERSGGWVWFAASVFYPVTAVLARRVNKGVPNIPAEGGALLVFNHVSHLDPVYDAVLVHKSRRTPRFLAKHSLWKPPLLKYVLDGCEQIPVYRGSADAKDSLRAADEALAKGRLVIIYPEATITRDPQGWPMRSRTGVARLALKNDVPVIPAARWGTLDIVDVYGKKYRPFPRGEVRTTVGEPVDLSAYRGQPITPQLLREVTDLLMHRVTELVAEIRGDAPPAEFYEPAQKPADPSSPDATPDVIPDTPADGPADGRG